MPKKYTNNLNNDDDEEKKSSGGYASEYIARRNGTSSGVSSGGYASQYIASKTQKRDSSKKQNTSDIRDAWRHQQESNGLYGAAQYYARSQQKQEREKFSSSDWFPFGSYSATFKRDEGTDLANRMRLSSAWEKAKEARKTEKKEEVPLFDETRTIRNPFSTEETPSESRGLFKLIGTPEERKYQYGVSEPSLKKPETIYDTHDFTLKRQEKEEEPADPELYNKLTVAAMSQPDFGRGSIKSNGSRDANSEYANRVLERIARGDAVDWESVPENVRNTIRAREMLEADPNLIDANAAGGSQYDPMHYWSSANEAERAVINYLSNTGQNEKLDEYISALGPVLQKRSTEEWEANVAEAVSSSPLAWLGGTAVGIMESPLRGVSYLHQVADYADDKKINEYADYNRFARLPNTITRAVSQKIAEEFPNVKFGMYDGPNNLLTGEEQNRAAFAYQTLESMGEFAYNAFLSGSFAGGFGKASGTEAAKNASEALVLSIMGTGAAATAVIESKERGLDDTQAFALGTIAGLAEVVTEKVSLEVLLNPNLSQGELM